MPKVVIKGDATKVKAKRTGNEIVITKKLNKASVAETHPAAPKNRRVTGKQKSPELITMSAADLKAITDNHLTAKAALKKSEESRVQDIAAMEKLTQTHVDDMQKKALKKQKKRGPKKSQQWRS